MVSSSNRTRHKRARGCSFLVSLSELHLTRMYLQSWLSCSLIVGLQRRRILVVVSCGLLVMVSFNDDAVAVAVSCGLLVEAVPNTAFDADAFVVAVPCGLLVIASFNEDAFAVAVAVAIFPVQGALHT